MKLNLLRGEHAKLKDTLKQTRAGYEEYVGELISKILRCDELLQRQSANAYTLNKMREKLVVELAAFSDPEKTPLLDPDKNACAIEGDLGRVHGQQ